MTNEVPDRCRCLFVKWVRKVLQDPPSGLYGHQALMLPPKIVLLWLVEEVFQVFRLGMDPRSPLARHALVSPGVKK
jgi:hypothetical protein